MVCVEQTAGRCCCGGSGLVEWLQRESPGQLTIVCSILLHYSQGICKRMLVLGLSSLEWGDSIVAGEFSRPQLSSSARGHF